MSSLLEKVFLRIMKDVEPKKLIRNIFRVNKGHLYIRDEQFKISNYSDIQLLAIGKASVEMANGVKEILGSKLGKGLVITPYRSNQLHSDFSCIVASHPVPDEKCFHAGRQLLEYINKIPSNTLFINCLSGGSSALVTLPAANITHNDLIRTYNQLLNSGANIIQMNAVRKHLSILKGGQVLRHLDTSTTLLDLVISDVPGDNFEDIGSGLTTPDTSTFFDAYQVLINYKLLNKIPSSVKNHIKKGLESEVSETVKPGNSPLMYHHQFLIGSAQVIAKKAADLLKEEGYTIYIAKEAYNNNVKKLANDIATKIKSTLKTNGLPAALVFYGESTVDVKGEGKGGRNQELALRGALEIQGLENVTWLSAGTDGIDGPTDAAGAIITGKIVPKAEKKGLDPNLYLSNNDSYFFHKKMGTLLRTGPTGNNLMDLQIVLLD